MATDEKKFDLNKVLKDAGDTGYYTVKEIADKIGFHKDTVYDWIYSRGLPIRRPFPRGRITIYWPDFIEWWSRLNLEGV